MSPPWKPFAISPERAAGMVPPYGEPLPQSPSAPLLSSIPPLSPTRSPIRSPMHRRTDSDVSVQGLATMFESLEVKDPREVAQRYKQMLDKEKAKWIEKLNKQEREHAMKDERKAVRIEELESELAQARTSLQVGVSKEQYEKEWKANKANIKKWEQIFKEREDRWQAEHNKVNKLEEHFKSLESKYRAAKERARELQIENLKTTSMFPTLQAKINGLKKDLQRAQSDADYRKKEAEQYKNQVYGLQVDLEGTAARLEGELQTLADKLKSTEAERDALKTSLKEEEVMRIAAEGNIALPIAGADESDEFGSPVRSPRKQRNLHREEDDKENVAPKKSVVEAKFLEQELATERRLRERAQDQIEFMKMECQFQCCSCRIAEKKGKTYVHDNAHAAEMERLKLSVPVITPSPSNHEDDVMDDTVIKQEPEEDERPFTPPAEETPTIKEEEDIDPSSTTKNTTELVHSGISEPEVVVSFSPTSGTFRSVPSPVKAHPSTHISIPAKPSSLGLLAVVQTSVDSSPWTPDAHSTIIPMDVVHETSIRRPTSKENKEALINIHEDVVEDEEEAVEDEEAQTPPATRAHYELRTTTTTIPIAFSPATPAFRPGKGPMTPSTIAHAASNARTPVLGELSLNIAPIDREAALRQIRERRGRARSMAEGHGTPMKQMLTKDRRDISAPVSRLGR
ncbi:hypothetical protein EK21DRAFT_97747 [Setomelanomma holmii]|uniref:Uncharacterized protein n=1 Tax=Setomelanomma holmii TaxID=210430 RepID=A0A9P4LQ82_9PLEO|nr:hypothetical protein EK21DRAFT_97747 [Setomelanomma holmii]